MYYVEYGKNGSKLIFSEKDGYLSQFAGSYELEVPFKSDKVTSHFSQYRKLTTKTFPCQWHPKSRENLELGKNRLVLWAILTEYAVRPI